METVRSSAVTELYRRVDQAQREYLDNIRIENAKRAKMEKPLPALSPGTVYYENGHPFISIDHDWGRLAYDFEGRVWNRGTWTIPDAQKPKTRIWRNGFLCDLEGKEIDNPTKMVAPTGVALPQPKRSPAY